MSQDSDDLSWDEWDELHDPRSDETEFDKVVESAISRRGFLIGVVSFGSGAAVMGTGSLLTATSAAAMLPQSRFPFKPIPIATDSAVNVPDGYHWQALAKWGQPLFSDAPEFNNGKDYTSEIAARTFGENTDGMELFNVDGREVIAVNHEFASKKVNLPNNKKGIPANLDDVLKLQNLQGVSVIEIEEGAEGWQIVLDSPYNRRITQNTKMRIAGPAAGHKLLKTSDDPKGKTVLGTLNNCGAGKTPWGTYLTCEENFNGYFGSTDPLYKKTEAFKRYGINPIGRYGYEMFDPRFDVSLNPNEPNRHGWIVEIDPADPDSTPVKRTALGRFKHENAAVTLAKDGRVVVYLGDDERGEYLYKYVSIGVYSPGGATDGLLDEGQLYVAKFNDDNTGEWIALTPDNTGGMSEAEILIYTRMAASKAKATTMDRPEWVTVNPVKAEAYCCLTNNKNRGLRPNKGGDETPLNGPNPREANKYGQIVRWFPTGDDHGSSSFLWDLYVMAGNPLVHKDEQAGSRNINKGNLFNSPDGMQFDSRGLLWIQTDGKDNNRGDYWGMGNNQMLVGDPLTGEIHRFLTGPKGSEVTGLTWSTDKKTMFVGIQHPKAPFPDGAGRLPRSTIIAIKRDDDDLVG